MKRRLSTLAAAAAVACAGAFATLPAQAGSNVSWGVSIGVPGFGFYAAQPTYGYGYGYRPYARPYVRPYAPYYAPAPVVYGPRVVYPAPYYGTHYYRPYAHRAPVYPRPVYRPYY